MSFGCVRFVQERLAPGEERAIFLRLSASGRKQRSAIVVAGRASDRARLHVLILVHCCFPLISQRTSTTHLMHRGGFPFRLAAHDHSFDGPVTNSFVSSHLLQRMAQRDLFGFGQMFDADELVA